jgi:hypothetical protein
MQRGGRRPKVGRSKPDFLVEIHSMGWVAFPFTGSVKSQCDAVDLALPIEALETSSPRFATVPREQANNDEKEPRAV